MKKYLLVQDDCAPDSLKYFEQQLLEKYKLTISDFKQKGIKIEFGYKYKNLCLEYYPEDPHWHLSKYSE